MESLLAEERRKLASLPRFFRRPAGLTSYLSPGMVGPMSTQEAKDRLELLQGTLDLLILRTLIFGSQHGQGIARAIQQTSEEELLVEHGALYPALQRLEERGWISAKWGTSVNNRKARFYSLTPAGQKQLVKETTKWKRLTAAIGRILESQAEGS
jgi:PadR family transcriptional regulator, regulatory protein PadR